MSKDRIPYFDFYPSDFMHGVRGLSAQEVGVYTMMLCRIYEENGPVEYHVMRLATYCGMREATFVKTVEKLIELGKLELVDGMISNHRAEAEISSRAHKLKINSKAGKASAEKRQRNQRSISTGVQQTFNHTDTDTDTTSSLRSDVRERAKKQDHVPEALEAYSALASRCGLPAVRVLNDARKRKLTALLKAHGLPVWHEALAKVEASDFCLGRKGDFRADLDFLLQQQSFTRLLEGRYDNRSASAGRETNQQSQQSELDDPRVLWLRLGQKLEHQNAANPDGNERPLFEAGGHAGRAESDDAPLRIAFAKTS